VRRGIRSITLDAATNGALCKLVHAARVDNRVAVALNLVERNPQPRPLTGKEVAELARVAGHPELSTERAVLRAASRAARPEVANNVAARLDVFYARPARVNASRIIEALIQRAAAGVLASEAEEAQATTNNAAPGYVRQAGHKSTNRTPRQTDAVTPIDRGAGKRRTA
jgi:uncharacterized protein with PIN domain